MTVSLTRILMFLLLQEDEAGKLCDNEVLFTPTHETGIKIFFRTKYPPIAEKKVKKTIMFIICYTYEYTYYCLVVGEHWDAEFFWSPHNKKKRWEWEDTQIQHRSSEMCTKCDRSYMHADKSVPRGGWGY